MRFEDRDYQEVLDPGRRRKALLYRAALACAVMLLLVVGLSLYDDEPGEESRPVAGPVERLDAAPKPLEVAPAPVEPVIAEEPDVMEEVRVEEEVDVLEGSARDEASAADQEQSADSQVAADQASATLEAEPPAAPAVAPAPGPSGVRAVPRAAPEASAPTLQSGYFVRLDAYGNPADIERLGAELALADHPARSQWRVSAGPYPNRSAAIEVMRVLERNHRQRGLVVQLPDGRHVVQLGVFGEVANADGLQRRVRAWGYPVMRDARIVLGPYAERSEADAAVSELGKTHGLQAVVVVPGGR